MKLYHYSNEEFEIVSPKFFGANQHSRNAIGDSEIPRSYFYVNKNDREKFFNGSIYRYIVGVAQNKIYDLQFDELNLLNKISSLDDMLKEIKKRKFIGVSFPQSEVREIVALFYPQKIIEREKLC